MNLLYKHDTCLQSDKNSTEQNHAYLKINFTFKPQNLKIYFLQKIAVSHFL